MLVTAALRHNVCLMVDAEHTYFQPVGGGARVLATKLWDSSGHPSGCRWYWCCASWWAWSACSPVQGCVFFVQVPQVPIADVVWL